MNETISKLRSKAALVFPAPTVDETYVRNNFDQLPLIEPESALPGVYSSFLKVALDEFSPESEVCEFLIYSLSPSNDHLDKKAWWYRRLSAFNDDQMSVFFEFLELVESDKDFNLIFEQVKRSPDRLKMIWNEIKNDV